MALDQREMESTLSSADQKQRLAIRPYRAQAIANLISAILSLSLLAFDQFWFIHITAAYAVLSICYFIPAITLNRKDGTVRKFHLIHLPIKRLTSDFKVVTISRTEKPGACYCVGLECPAEPLVVIETNDYAKAREFSESVATFLVLNIRDDALKKTTFHRRRNIDSTNESVSSAQEDWAEQTRNDRATILSGLDSSEVLEIRRRVGFEVYSSTAMVSMMAVSGLLFFPPLPGMAWLTQVMRGNFAFIIVVSFSSFLRHRGGIILVRDSPYLFTWKALRLRPLMKIRAVREFDRVTLSYEERLSEKGKRAEFHCIRLDGESVPVTILETKDDTRAAKLAAQVAEFLSLPIDDFMVLDETKTTLRLKITATDADWTLTPPPIGIAIEHERCGDEFVFKGSGTRLPSLETAATCWHFPAHYHQLPGGTG
jgi:hypothetical protein